MFAITTVSGGQPAALPFEFFSMDKVAHLLVFGLLATSIYRASSNDWPQAARTALAIGLTAVFGLSDELHQSTTPGRVMDFADWTADVVGGVLAVFVYRAWSGYRRCLELALPRRKTQNDNP